MWELGAYGWGLVEDRPAKLEVTLAAALAALLLWCVSSWRGRHATPAWLRSVGDPVAALAALHLLW